MIDGIKYKWRLPDNNLQKAATLAARFNFSIPVIQALLTRRYQSAEEMERFLFCDRTHAVAEPALLKDAEKAVARIILAIEKKEKILVCGDYDVDGITAASMMLKCLLPLGAHVNFFLPNRTRDGYGLSTKTIERAANSNYTVVITVDNGITAFEPALKARELGIDLIITDHHKTHDRTPDAFAIINPNQHDCVYPFKDLAGVGVAFKCMSLLYEKLGKPLPDQAYELLMLGTIADVVPLIDENRFWVRHGLRHIKEHESLTLRTLKQNGRIEKTALTALDIGFFIAPQINALGRLDDPRDAVTFLLSCDTADVERIGATLAQLNEKRKSIERGILAGIDEKLKTCDMVRERVIVACDSSWPSGVIGLVASRLVGLYHRPTFLFHVTPDGLARGSCRSIPAFNIFEALADTKDLLTSFGGHAAAAGLSLPAEKLPLFKKRMEEIIDKKLTPEDLQPTVQLDAELPLAELNTKLAQDLAYLEPFGCQNGAPLFYIRRVSIAGEVKLLKDAHVKCLIFADGLTKPVIFFNRPDIFAFIQKNREELFDLAAHVSENHWNGTVRVELQGIDLSVYTPANARTHALRHTGKDTVKDNSEGCSKTAARKSTPGRTPAHTAGHAAGDTLSGNNA